MGMTDEVICDYPLPNLPKFIGPDYIFQTKDLDCLGNEYFIAADGQFSDPDFTGVINLYASNLFATGPGLYTKNGEDAETVNYSVKILDGKVQEALRSSYSRRPAIKIEPMQSYVLTGEEEKNRNIANTENLIGKSVYVLWGGKETGYWVKVVYSGEKEHCVESDRGLEKLHRFQRNIIFFDTEEEAFSYRDNRNKSWQNRKEIYEIYATQRQLEIDKEISNLSDKTV
jgi:hypothetical protein